MATFKPVEGQKGQALSLFDQDFDYAIFGKMTQVADPEGPYAFAPFEFGSKTEQTYRIQTRDNSFSPEFEQAFTPMELRRELVKQVLSRNVSTKQILELNKPKVESQRMRRIYALIREHSLKQDFGVTQEVLASEINAIPGALSKDEQPIYKSGQVRKIEKFWKKMITNYPVVFRQRRMTEESIWEVVDLMKTRGKKSPFF